MPRVPGENDGLGRLAAVVGVVSLVIGVVVPLFALGGVAGLWLSLRARQRVLDGDASNGRAVLLGLVTSSLAAAWFVLLLVVGVLREAGVVVPGFGFLTSS